MKKNINKKPANTANTANTANKAVKVINIGGKNMSESDIQAILTQLAAANAAKLALEADKAALEEKVNKTKTSKSRQPKVAATYDVLQPIYVSLRSFINTDVIDNDTLLAIFADTAKALSVDVSDVKMQQKLHENTVLHNSTSNMAKAKDLRGIESRESAYKAMVEQAKVLLSAISADKWQEYQKLVDTAAKKAKDNL